MKTLERLNQELETAKNNVKVFKAANIIVEAFLNKEQFSFSSLGMNDVEIFHKDLFSCGSINVHSNRVKHFEEMFELQHDFKTTKTKELKAALKLIEKEKKNEKSIAFSILCEIADEKIK